MFREISVSWTIGRGSGLRRMSHEESAEPNQGGHEFKYVCDLSRASRVTGVTVPLRLTFRSFYFTCMFRGLKNLPRKSLFDDWFKCQAVYVLQIDFRATLRFLRSRIELPQNSCSRNYFWVWNISGFNRFHAFMWFFIIFFIFTNE